MVIAGVRPGQGGAVSVCTLLRLSRSQWLLPLLPLVQLLVGGQLHQESEHACARSKGSTGEPHRRVLARSKATLQSLRAAYSASPLPARRSLAPHRTGTPPRHTSMPPKHNL